MPIPVDDTSDFEKLSNALSILSGNVASFDDLLQVFGLANMPVTHQYGILFGFAVFTLTIAAVVTLLILGGSFRRIAEQASTGEVTVTGVVETRLARPLLYESLLEARERMMKENYKPRPTTEGKTSLMKMILNAPIELPKVAELADEDAKKRVASGSKVPPGYVDAYVEAYRKCQEKPGGAAISGHPEARFEAYARAWAGCNQHVNRDYRRSYARLYEYVACQNHANVEKFQEHFVSRPGDLVGRLVRLEALEVERHLGNLFDITCGDSYFDNKAYDPNEVWGFLPYGPFKNKEELRKSTVFQRREDEAAFAIVESVTGRMVGVAMLSRDEPWNLTVQLETPIIKPSSEGSMELLEGMFLVMDRLIALGYRRIQMAVDSQDQANKKLAAGLGFTKEAEIPKHMVVKDSNRDSTIYGMLNSDWSKGARTFLFKKLHGAKLAKIDQTNNKKEGEIDEQMQQLAEKKALAEEAGKATNGHHGEKPQ